jgi:hypothetical protein
MTTPITSEVIEDAVAAGLHEPVRFERTSVYAAKLTKFAQLQRLREHSSKDVATRPGLTIRTKTIGRT